MQTFITSRNLNTNARNLDYRRLGKQRVECKQIYLALTDPTYGWQNHPAVRMWRGYEMDLLYYAWTICREWTRRGYNDTLTPFFVGRLGGYTGTLPPHLRTNKLIRSHRSNLIRKLPEHYAKLWPNVPNNLDYVWPTNN